LVGHNYKTLKLIEALNIQNMKINHMTLETRYMVDEIEAIKVRLISLETMLIETEEASKEDVNAVKEALDEYKKGKTKPQTL